MRIFVGYGYNGRDQWIEDHVFPILGNLGFTVVHGKDLQGQPLQDGVRGRLDQSDAVVGFFTVREGQGAADFTSHMWVRDEMVYAHARNKTIVPIKEEGVRVPDGLLGNRQYIPLRQEDRLKCVAELVQALGRRNIRRIRLEPDTDQLRRDLNQWRRNPAFVIRYRVQDQEGVESNFQTGRLELVDQGFYLNVGGVPDRAYVEVEGALGGDTKFNSGWVSVDAVLVRIN
jgi:hypothetical protein